MWEKEHPLWGLYYPDIPRGLQKGWGTAGNLLQLELVAWVLAKCSSWPEGGVKVNREIVAFWA